MTKVINCPCGYVVRAKNDDDLVAQVQRHAQEAHDLKPTREEVLAMARPE